MDDWSNKHVDDPASRSQVTDEGMAGPTNIVVTGEAKHVDVPASRSDRWMTGPTKHVDVPASRSQNTGIDGCLVQ